METSEDGAQDVAGSLQELEVQPDEAGLRLDQFLVRRLAGVSRARVKAAIAEGGVRVGGRLARKGQRVASGDRVVLSEAPGAADFEPVANAELAVAILYEDDAVVVVDKPAGMPSHPLRAAEEHSVVQALLARYPEMRGVGYARREAGIVHRLDRDTSGVLVAARTAEAFESLRASLRGGQWDKRYLALCEGHVEKGVIDLPITTPKGARKAQARLELSMHREAYDALTEILEVEALGAFSLVEVRVRSGRRHQVRAHLAAVGHPLVGDELYGGPLDQGLGRHSLHASRVILPAPGDGASDETIDVRSPLPEELQALVEQLRARS